jgi:hypothetical protein
LLLPLLAGSFTVAAGEHTVVIFVVEARPMLVCLLGLDSVGIPIAF